jgi:hypothetical protein
VPLTFLAATAPSPFWYATRSAGVLSLVLLTAVMVLGVATTAKLDLGSRWRFVLNGLHRNLSLLAVAFLAIHVLAAILDPYAKLGWRDALAPFVSSYRPLYLGLGVVSMEVLAAVVVTALAQRWLGRRTFRVVHWAAYGSWPIAVIHSLGTGSDVRSAWFYLVTAICVGAVVAVLLAWRVQRGDGRWRRLRAGAAVATLLGVAGLGAWSFAGPLQPGWALASGTPPDLVKSAQGATTPGGVASLPPNLNDRMLGTLIQVGNGYRIDVIDSRDSRLAVRILFVGANASQGTVSVTRSGTALCSFDADLVNPLTGTCAGTSLQLQLSISRGGRVLAQLVTGGPAAGSV